MRLFIAALVLAAPLFGQTLCNFTLQPASFSIGAGAYSGTVTVTPDPGNLCTGWTASATSTGNWLKITSGPGGNGAGQVTFTADANPLGVSRTGTLKIANVNVPVVQAGAACKFALTPTTQNFSAAGGTGSFNVTANCAWNATATSNPQQFIAVPATTQGTTDTTVKFTVAANGCYGGRSGTITMNGSGLSPSLVTGVTQDGSPSNFTMSATSASVDSTASDGRFTVSTGVGCGWTASSDVSWMTVTAGASGSGSGGIAYHLLANSTATRAGSIHVTVAPGTQLLYTVTQQAAGPPAPQISTVNSAASYAADAVSPGQIVTIFGKSMGPSTLTTQQASGGVFGTSVAGTQVLFDGVAAPMIYSRQDQVSAVAPYSLAGGSTQVQVKYNGTLSNAMTMTVQAATPGIFSLDATGLGPGAILNQDYGINGSGNPAARGSVVSIYCTGGGATSPALADGALVASELPLPQITQPYSVTIGGLNARVFYAGGSPGSIAGLIQVNAEVPANTKVGTGIPVVVTIGNWSSLGGVTMSVK